MNQKFKKRIEGIFKGFEVFLYVECPQGADRKIKVDDYRPWIEFDLRPLKRTHAKESCHVPLKALVKLAKLLGTEDVTVTGFDMGYDCPHHHDSCTKDPGTDFVGYVLARAVKFKKGAK